MPAQWKLAFAFLLVATTVATPGRTEDWKAGVATANITPQQLMSMAGYGSRNHPAEGTAAEGADVGSGGQNPRGGL